MSVFVRNTTSFRKGVRVVKQTFDVMAWYTLCVMHFIIMVEPADRSKELSITVLRIENRFLHAFCTGVAKKIMCSLPHGIT
jgi:hypothetical protein